MAGSQFAMRRWLSARTCARKAFKLERSVAISEFACGIDEPDFDRTPANWMPLMQHVERVTELRQRIKKTLWLRGNLNFPHR
jgi:hypothetical protein